MFAVLMTGGVSVEVVQLNGDVFKEVDRPWLKATFKDFGGYSCLWWMPGVYCMTGAIGEIRIDR